MNLESRGAELVLRMEEAMRPGANEKAGKPGSPEVVSDIGLSPWTQLGVQSAELSHYPSPQGVPESKAGRWEEPREEH